jgi:hypothetical protein
MAKTCGDKLSDVPSVVVTAKQQDRTDESDVCSWRDYNIEKTRQDFIPNLNIFGGNSGVKQIPSYCTSVSEGPKARGFKPGRGKWIFKGNKNQQQTFLWRESRAVGPMPKDLTC